ncbi:molybdenum cofactor biosynthesis protein MoaE [Roseivirga misakiensis]|uniref:Molybdopterin synthase catalytic subunit n=1 Tax=Roseivirga misakiensis TaxID=1563681 RepID=A0A1E5SZY7_9BACT|nr:molybdenum cofactor biosynthesis protein MoaE [Roseivirga misakiensis]OEK04698.1 molybdenum cofactor biosynthesis protein MoaE [Roseivirga misakiensis]
MREIFITEHKLDAKACTEAITYPGAGGIVVFVGTVRDQTKGKTVKHLEFEAYEPMALKEMKKIADYATKHWSLHQMVIHHRTGLVQIEEEAVVIACSSAHRKEAFEACQYAIDTLKETVPIWKKEVFEDGEVWVSAHP